MRLLFPPPVSECLDLTPRSKPCPPFPSPGAHPHFPALVHTLGGVASLQGLRKEGWDDLVSVKVVSFILRVCPLNDPLTLPANISNANISEIIPLKNTVLTFQQKWGKTPSNFYSHP